jgi:hypothetical protein
MSCVGWNVLKLRCIKGQQLITNSEVEGIVRITHGVGGFLRVEEITNLFRRLAVVTVKVGQGRLPLSRIHYSCLHLPIPPIPEIHQFFFLRGFTRPILEPKT